VSAVAQDGRAAAFSEAARRYSELEWALVRADGKRPRGIGWEKTLPEEPELAAGKWSHWGTTMNLGVVCGTSGVAVIDVDIDDDPEGALLALLGTDTLPETPICRTGRGRLQVYFADPGGLEKRVDALGIELRVGPHFCVAPPSIHPDTGGSYKWLIGHAPWGVPLAPLPARVIEHFGAVAGNRSVPAAPVGEIIPAGRRNGTLASLAGTLRRKGLGQTEILAALEAVNRERCRPPLASDELATIAASIGRYPAQESVGRAPNGAERATKTALEGESVSLRAPNGADGAPARLQLHHLTDYKTRQVVWYDKPFWQASAFHLLAGRKGSCKGTFTALLAARVTTGDLCGEPKRVLVVTSEDSVELDFLPRFIAAGGNPEMVEMVVGPFQLPHDIGWMREQAERLGDVGLIVIDPLGNHLGDGDTYKPGIVRDAIGPLNGLADGLNCIVLGVHHLGKDTSKGALASVLGSTAFVDVPRCVILMAADNEDERLYHAQVVAGNRGPRGEAGRQFRLELVDVPPAKDITLVVPDGLSSKDVDDLLAPKGADGNGKSGSRSAQARELILDILDEEGETESDGLDERVADETGLARRTVINLRDDLRKEGLIRSRKTTNEYGQTVKWFVRRTEKPRNPEPHPSSRAGRETA
jgi:hypothetical protein